VGFELRFFLRDLNHRLDMTWSEPSHPLFRFPYIPSKGCIGHLEAHSLICSPRELGEGQEDGNGSIERGKLGRLHPWKAHGGLGPYYLLLLVIACVMSPFWDIITLQHFIVLCLPE
jgi:hypothetical protein